MRSSFSYYQSSSSSIFYRASKWEAFLFACAGFLFIWGCFCLAKAGSLERGANSDMFLIGTALASLGFFLSWYVANRWMWLMVAIALTARIVLVPMSSSGDLSRRLWEGEVLDTNLNPYELAPANEELRLLRDGMWERIRDKERASTQAPATMVLFRAFNSLGFSEWTAKMALVVVDIWICIILAMRYGSKRAALYGWNPLVVYCIAGEGRIDSLTLLPALGGFLIWDAWIDRKGGAVVIANNGGLSGGPGQMVSFAALLVGLAVAMNIIFLPILIWMFWQVLSKSGMRTGLVIFVIGLIPVAAFSGWGAYSLGADMQSLLPFSGAFEAGALSLLPQALDYLGLQARPEVYYLLIVLITFLLMIRNEPMGRFANLFFGVYFIFVTTVFPWHFIWLAPFAIGANHMGFRLVSVSAFAYYLAWSASGELVVLKPWQFAILWLPFVAGMLWYGIKERTKSSGFYVRSY